MVTAHLTHLRVGMVNEVNLCLDDKFRMGVTSNPSEVLLRKPNLHIRLVEGESRIFAHFSALIALEFVWIALESCWILIAESEFRNLKKKTVFYVQLTIDCIMVNHSKFTIRFNMSKSHKVYTNPFWLWPVLMMPTIFNANCSTINNSTPTHMCSHTHTRILFYALIPMQCVILHW